MKKLFFKLLFILPIPIGMSIVNYFIDPAYLFHNAHEEEIAQILLSNHNVAIAEDAESRLVQKFYINASFQRKDIVVFGSSRVFQIGSEASCSKSFFNSGVNRATIEDYYALYDLYKKKLLLPSKILIGLDPWILNKNNSLTDWVSYGENYYSGAGLRINTAELAVRRIGKRIHALFSIPYFKESLRVVRDILEKKVRPSIFFETMENAGDVHIQLADGSLVYPRSSREATLDQINQAARRRISHGNEPFIGMKDFYHLDHTLIAAFEAFVEMAKKDGVHIEFFLAPFHPDVYDFLSASQKYAMVQEAQSYFFSFAHINKIPIIGSYSPYQFGLTNIDFFDGVHPNRNGIKKILEGKKICL